MLTNLEVAKSKLALYCNEFVMLLHKLELVPLYVIPTAATDGVRMFYNPGWFDTLTVSEIAGVIIHEIVHNMQGHPARMLIGNRDHDEVNIAMDIIVNQMINVYFAEIKAKSSGAFAPCLPACAIQGEQYDKFVGWNWEKVYYERMADPNRKRIKLFDCVRPGANADGSTQNAKQAEALAKEWKMAAQQAATIAKSRGLHSSFFESYVQDLIATKVDWQAQVIDIATKAAKEETSYRRFNRKHIYRKIYLPGLYSEKLGNILFATDTSGSMDDGSFRFALGGMNEIMYDLKPDKVWAIDCDVGIKSIKELTCDDLPIKAKAFKGRGGTTLTPVFKWIREQEDPLDLVVFLTDGEHEIIEKKWQPECPVVWLICNGGDGDNAKASFGKVLHV